jgi:hypothetical protein
VVAKNGSDPNNERGVGQLSTRCEENNDKFKAGMMATITVAKRLAFHGGGYDPITPAANMYRRIRLKFYRPVHWRKRPAGII